MDLEINLPQEKIDELMKLEVLIINGKQFIDRDKVLSMMVKFYELRNKPIEDVAKDLYEALDEADDIFNGNVLFPINLQDKVDRALVNYEQFKGNDE